MHSNLSDHNNWSKSMNTELSALEIVRSKLGLSTDSVLDDQEKNGNKQPEVAIIRVKGNNNNNKHIDYRLIVCYAKIAFTSPRDQSRNRS